MTQTKPWRPEENTADSRWSWYIKQFSGMPIYYFEGLPYPNSNREAVSTIQVLNAEIENISLQIIEMDVNITRNPGSDLSSLYTKKTKAVRAQKMKMAQIKIMEAWQLNQSVDIEKEIKNLSAKLAVIKSALLHVIEESSDTEMYLRVADMLSEV